MALYRPQFGTHGEAHHVDDTFEVENVLVIERRREGVCVCV